MLRLILDFLAYKDPRPTTAPKDATKLEIETEYSSFRELCRKSVEVADAVTDQTVTLADPTSEFLIVSTDQEITVKLNGGSEQLTLTPRVSGAKTPCLMLKGTVTGLTVSNASGQTANIDIISVNL